MLLQIIRPGFLKMINHSFAVVVYKDSPFLSECLESLKKQTVESLIFISTSTPSAYIFDVAKKFGVEVFVADTGGGIANDWNFALSKARTKYVTLAHQDDVYMPEYAEKCYDRAEKFSDTLICFTGYSEIVNGRERVLTLMLRLKHFMLSFFMLFKRNVRSKFWKKFLLSAGNPIPCPTVMYNLEALNSFRFSNEYVINLDWDAWYRMAKMDGRFVYATGSMLKHRIHPDSETTVGLKNNVRQIEDVKMFSCFWPSFIAKILSHIYAWSYKSNEIRQ